MVMEKRPKRLLIVMPTLGLLGLGWILFLIDFGRYHVAFLPIIVTADEPVDGAYFVAFLPFWIFSFGVPAVILFVFLDAALDHPAMGIIARFITASCAITLGGCLYSEAQRVYVFHLVSSSSSSRASQIAELGVPIAGLVGGILCVLSLLALIGLNPYLWKKCEPTPDNLQPTYNMLAAAPPQQVLQQYPPQQFHSQQFPPQQFPPQQFPPQQFPPQQFPPQQFPLQQVQNGNDPVQFKAPPPYPQPTV